MARAKPRIWGLWSQTVLLTISNTISIDAFTILAEHLLGRAGTVTGTSPVGGHGSSKKTQWNTLDTSLCLVFATWTESFGIRKPWAILATEKGLWRDVLPFLLTMSSNRSFNYFET